MGVIVLPSTLDGGFTPICNSCGVALCWDLSDFDYQENKSFWDNWVCKDCNPNYKGALTRFKQQKEPPIEGL